MRIRYRMILALFLVGVIPTLVYLVQGNQQLSATQNAIHAEIAKISSSIVPDANGNISGKIYSDNLIRATGNLDRGIRSAKFVLNLVGFIVLATVASLAFFLGDRLISPFEWMASTSKRAWRVIQSMFKNIPLPPRQDEIGIMSHILGVMETQLKEEFTNMEKQIRLRTGELRQRTLQLQAAAQIVQDTADILDVKHLLTGTVSLISERFSYYHVGIYMLDEFGDIGEKQTEGNSESREESRISLQASYLAGSGTQTKDRSYKLGESIVGYVAQKGELLVTADLATDQRFIRPPELPLSRSAVTIPLKARGKTIGVLDIHSTNFSNFSEDDVAVLQILADQIGLAVENARLFERSRVALDAERRAYGEISRREWLELVSSRPEWGYRSDKSGLYSSQGKWQPWMLEAAQQAQPVIIQSGEKKIVSLPVKVREQVIGVLDFRKSGEGEQWSQEEIDLLNNLTDQLSQALEGARLYQETQLRAEREHILSDITSKVRASTNVNVILQTAVRELADALRISRTTIQLRSVSNEERLVSEGVSSGSNGGSSHE